MALFSAVLITLTLHEASVSAPNSLLNVDSVPDVEIFACTANYCQPCQRMGSVLDQLEQDGVSVRRIKITTHSRVTQQHKVNCIPTLIVKVSGEEKQRLVGYTSNAAIQSELVQIRGLQTKRQLGKPQQPSISGKKSMSPAQEPERPKNAHNSADQAAPQANLACLLLIVVLIPLPIL